MLATDTVLQGRYRIVKLLSQGGMGAVYQATDERLGNTVALKETFFSDDTLRRAFEREARLLASLKHQALPKVSDHFTEDAGQFLVMEFIPGNDLAQMLQNRGFAFPPDQALEWADQLLDALDYLHTQEPPIIHRDIKPQNLKLTPRGQIILLDFGLAKGMSLAGATATAGQSIFGYTPNYAALEQIQAEGTEARSDLYSLAATLYHLMTNAMPPGALTRISAVAAGQADPLRPANEINPHISSAVARTLMWAMALHKDQRPASASAMRKAMRDAAKSATAASGNSPALAPTIPSPPSFTTPPAQQTFPASAPPSNPNQGGPSAAGQPYYSQTPPSWPPQQQSSWPQPPPPVQSSWPQPFPPSAPRQKSKSGVIVLSVVFALLLLVGGAVAAFYYPGFLVAGNDPSTTVTKKPDASSADSGSTDSKTVAPGKAVAPENSSAGITVERVIEKYIDALGGEEALRSVSSRVMKGSFEISDIGMGGTIEVYSKAPDKYLSIISGPGPLSTRLGYNGSVGWSKEPTGGVRELAGGELEGMKRDADFNLHLRMNEVYTGLSLAGREKVGGKDAYVIEAGLPEGGSDIYFFDSQSGLLLRVDLTREGQQGTITIETLLEDYRDVDGIKIPFTIRQSSSIVSIVIRVREVRHNVQIKDSLFDEPSR